MTGLFLAVVMAVVSMAWGALLGVALRRLWRRMRQTRAAALPADTAVVSIVVEGRRRTMLLPRDVIRDRMEAYTDEAFALLEAHSKGGPVNLDAVDNLLADAEAYRAALYGRRQASVRAALASGATLPCSCGCGAPVPAVGPSSAG